MSIIQGKTAIVTGGGRGIGRATALQLAQEGCDIAVVARTTAQIEQVVAEIRQIGRRALAITCDQSNGQSVTEAYARITRELGSIDLLINCAGVANPMGSTDKISLEEWTQNIEINLIGSFRWIYYVLPHMVEQHWGRIVSITSGGDTDNGLLTGSAYTVSKMGLEILTRNLAEEYQHSGITINTIRPGATYTELFTNITRGSEAAVGHHIYTLFKTIEEKGLSHSADVPARLIINVLKSESNGEIVDIYSERGQSLLNASLGE